MIDYVPYAHIIRALHQHVSNCTYGFLENEDKEIIFYTKGDNAYVRCFLTRTFNIGTAEQYEVTTPAGFFPISNMRKRHAAIVNPDIRDIDNCIRRAIAKEIGMHTGIGMSLWADSDPYDDSDEETTEEKNTAPKKLTKQAFVAAIKKSLKDRELTDFGVMTICKLANVPDVNNIPQARWQPLLDVLQNPQNIDLFNSGKNTKGAVVLEKEDRGDEKSLDELMKEADEVMS